MGAGLAQHASLAECVAEAAAWPQVTKWLVAALYRIFFTQLEPRSEYGRLSFTGEIFQTEAGWKMSSLGFLHWEVGRDDLWCTTSAIL